MRSSLSAFELLNNKSLLLDCMHSILPNVVLAMHNGSYCLLTAQKVPLTCITSSSLCDVRQADLV